jgi:hypothetical protein
MRHKKRPLTVLEKKALIAAFQLKQTLTDKALAKKFARTPKSIADMRYRWRNT